MGLKMDYTLEEAKEIYLPFFGARETDNCLNDIMEVAEVIKTRKRDRAQDMLRRPGGMRSRHALDNIL